MTLETRVNESPQSPSLLRRCTAMLYDTFLVVALTGAALAFALAIQVGFAHSSSHELHPAVARTVIIVSLYGFFVLFWVKQGQTLGMQAWRIQLVSMEGGNPRLSQALLRCVGATLSAACLGLGYLWCLVDKRKRYWHDYLSGTELILLAKRDKAESTGSKPDTG